MYNESSSSPTVRNTLFVKGAQGSNCAGDAFAAASANNMANDDSCGGSTAPADTINLGMLGSYGGSTLTVPLLAGSAGIDVGNPAFCPPTDQRGFGRRGQCDIGAFEWWPLTYLPLVLKQ